MIRKNDNVFELHTRHSTYAFQVLPTGHLEHLYYGRKINVNADALTQKHAFAASNTVVIDQEHLNLTLEDERLELSGYGKGDYREAFLDLVHFSGSATSDFRFASSEIRTGKDTMTTLPSSCGSEAETEHREELAQIENQLETVIAEQEREKLQAESPYASLYPDFYAPQELSANTREAGVMYLTFDDGPSARTREVLDILKKKDVKATFFVVGSTGEEGEALLRRIVEEGHTLGMHSYSHNYSKIYASTEDYLADMYRIFTQIRDTTGFTPTLFRFPGGSINGYNSAIYQDLIAEMMRRGFVPFDWNVSSADASERPVEVDVLVSNVISGARKVERGVVLMHDSAPRVTTVQALETMIDSLRAMGFELKALTPDVMPLLYAYRN